MEAAGNAAKWAQCVFARVGAQGHGEGGGGGKDEEERQRRLVRMEVIGSRQAVDMCSGVQFADTKYVTCGFRGTFSVLLSSFS